MVSVVPGPRRARLRFALIGGLAILLGGGATLAYAEDPTVTFTGTGTPPLTCSSTPDVSGLTIFQGTKVNLVNNTGVPATVFVGGVEGVTLENAMAVRVKLKAGQHSVELRPDCLVAERARALVVTVVLTPVASSSTATNAPAPSAGSGAPPSDVRSGGTVTTPPGAATGGGTSTSGSGTDTSGYGSAGSGGSGSGGSGGSGSGGSDQNGSGSAESPGGGSGATSGASAAGTGDSVPDTGLATFDEPYSVGGSNSSYGANLLAVIALICVLGVSAAIIRAILAQRAHGAIAG